MSIRQEIDTDNLPFTLTEYESAAEALTESLTADGFAASVERQRNGEETSEHPFVLVRFEQACTARLLEFEEKAIDTIAGKSGASAIPFKVIPGSSRHISPEERKSFGRSHLQIRFAGLVPSDSRGSWSRSDTEAVSVSEPRQRQRERGGQSAESARSGFAERRVRRQERRMHSRRERSLLQRAGR